MSHASVPAVVSRVGDGRMRVAVTDLDRPLPVFGMPTADDRDDNHGLARVAAVSEDWGIIPRHRGTRVWAELAA